MASVGSSDSSNRNSENDVVRRSREAYESKESELVKKQAKELRRINEQHYSELERIKQDHDAQIQELRKTSNDTISARDYRHQKDIEDIRTMHKKQVQTMADEHRSKDENFRTSTQTELESRKRFNDDRFEKLNEDFQKKLSTQAESYSANTDDSRESQIESMNKLRQKMGKQHEEERRALADYHTNHLREMSGKYTELRENVDQERKQVQIQRMQDRQKSSNDMMSAVRKERMSRDNLEAILRDGFSDSLRQTRERFEGKAQKERAGMQADNNAIKNNAIDRVNNQVNRLENDKSELKEKNLQDDLRSKAQKQIELKNVRDAYQKNIEAYRTERDEAVRQLNDQNHQEVQKVRGEMDKQLTDTNRFYRGRMDETNRISRTAIDNMKGDFEARRMGMEEATNERVRRISENAEQGNSRLNELQIEQHQASQRIKGDEMKALRERLETEKLNAVNGVMDQMRKQELRHADKMSMTVSKYEKQVQVLKDQMLRERKLNDENTKRLTEELGRLHKMEVDQVETKNRDKLRQVNHQHSEELRSVSKRHEERLDQVLTEAKRS
jgi:hypothetical protein